MVEGGPTLAAAFVAADLVDAVYLFYSSKRVGPGGIDALEGLPLTTLTQSPRLRCITSEPVGADTLTVLERR
jgi:diaminohydroxyphosphoribosylaminopyrimidine deaminase/5-amino-6-(5-phosphoribosylamino)uracil reductase